MCKNTHAVAGNVTRTPRKKNDIQLLLEIDQFAVRILLLRGKTFYT